MASCFDGAYAYSTPAYTSLDAARTVTIGYRGSLAHPMGVITLDATDTTASRARQMSVKLWHGSSPVTFTNGTTESFFTAGTGTSTNPMPRVDTAATRARITDARGATTAYKLDGFGAPPLIQEPLGRVTQIVRDYADRATQVDVPSGNRLISSYTGADLTGTYNQYTGRTVRMDYEPTYHQVTRVYGDADSVWNYWSGGKLDSSRTGTSTRAVAKYSYDGRGRMTQRIDPGGHYTTIYYAATGWQNTDSTRVVGRTSSEHFNSWGLIDRTTDPRGVSSYFAYDWNGNVTSGTNRRGQTTTGAYDALDQLTSRSAGGTTTTYAPDPLGRVRCAGSAHVNQATERSRDLVALCQRVPSRKS